MPKLKPIVIVLCLVMAGASYADNKPIELRSLIQDQKPFGQGNLTKLLINIYDAELWTDAPQWSWNEVFALTLRYHIDIDQNDLTEKSIERINRLTPLSQLDAQYYATQLNTLFPAVKNGDEITAVYFPNKGVDFYHNGTSTGSITDMVFARKFLDIWFSDKTSEPELRAELLNLSDHQGKTQ